MLQQLPADIRVLLGESPEVPKAQHEATHGPVRGHRRRADAFTDQGELAEMFPGAQLFDLIAVQAHRRRSVEDDEEGVSALLALAHDSGPGLDLALPEVACEPPQLPLRQAAEEGELLQFVNPASHRPILTANRG